MERAPDRAFERPRFPPTVNEEGQAGGRGWLEGTGSYSAFRAAGLTHLEARRAARPHARNARAGGLGS